ncbi:major facilitator superfamily domain-containing protein, partial [Talaromyces proteolyticus]
RLYKRRYFGLIQLILLNIIVSWDWVTYTVVPTTASEYLGVSDNAITWLSTAFMLAYCGSALFVFHAVDRFGLKGTNIITSLLLFVGNWIRYVGTIERVNNYGVVMFGQVVIGLAQPFCLSTPSKYSDTWFSSNGRTSATAIATLANPLGAAIAQFANPSLAATPDQVPQMVLVISIISTVGAIPSFFIPSKPPTPPSSTEVIEKIRVFDALKGIIKTRELWLLMLPFAIYVALFNTVVTLINQAIIPYGATETQAGIAGGILIGAGIVGTAIISPLNDRFKWHLWTVRILFPISAVMYIALIWAPASSLGIWPIYVVSALMGAMSFGLSPVVLELLAETTFPYSPEVSSTISWLGGQVFGVVFIVVQSALIAGPSANPPYNMTNSLIFGAVVSGVFLPFPLSLGFFGHRVKRNREEH